jgi:hypothetical protein
MCQEAMLHSKNALLGSSQGGPPMQSVLNDGCVFMVCHMHRAIAELPRKTDSGINLSIKLSRLT